MLVVRKNNLILFQAVLLTLLFAVIAISVDDSDASSLRSSQEYVVEQIAHINKLAISEITISVPDYTIGLIVRFLHTPYTPNCLRLSTHHSFTVAQISKTLLNKGLTYLPQIKLRSTLHTYFSSRLLTDGHLS